MNGGQKGSISYASEPLNFLPITARKCQLLPACPAFDLSLCRERFIAACELCLEDEADGPLVRSVSAKGPELMGCEP